MALMYTHYFFCLLSSMSDCEYRLRQDSQLLQSRAINWSSQDFQTPNLNGSTNSISSSTGNINNDCSESNSSTETLKWLGSMSDVSVASQATSTSTLSGKHCSQIQSICHQLTISNANKSSPRPLCVITDSMTRMKHEIKQNKQLHNLFGRKSIRHR